MGCKIVSGGLKYLGVMLHYVMLCYTVCWEKTLAGKDFSCLSQKIPENQTSHPFRIFIPHDKPRLVKATVKVSRAFNPNPSNP